MKYLLSFVPLSVFVFFIATSTVTLTGCSNLLGVGDTVKDTVSIEKLSVPTVDSVEVLAGGKTAKIHLQGSHVNSENFCGYYLLSGNVTNATIVQKDSLSNGDAWTGTTSFTVPIKRDSIQIFWISAYNKKADRSQAVPALVFGRVSTNGTVSAFTFNSNQDGLDVDGAPAVKDVEDSIRATDNPVKYATNTGCDLIVERLKVDTTKRCITPIGGAVVFLANDTAIYTRSQLSDIYEKSYQDTLTTLSTYNNIRVFAQGHSVRDGSGLYQLKDGDYFIVITSAKNVARIKVQSATGSGTTLVIYQDSGRNAGEPLYKKVL